MPEKYNFPGPAVDEISVMTGAVALEFGTDWCGYCNTSRTAIDEALSNFPEVTHLKVEDGPGRKLGRFFHVKLWPTVVFLKNGKEKGRVVRPASSNDITAGLKDIAD